MWIFVFTFMIVSPIGFTVFPYTTLFRSLQVHRLLEDRVAQLGDDLVLLLERLLGLLLRREVRDGDQAQVIQRRRSEEHTSELQSRRDIVCRLLLENKKYNFVC